MLKSLTAVDLGDARFSSIRYNSVVPLDERLKALRLPFGEQVIQADFLAALRGARVEVRSGTASATGRLLSVEKALLERYTGLPHSQMDRLGVLNREIADLPAKQTQAEADFDQMVQGITLDENW